MSLRELAFHMLRSEYVHTVARQEPTDAINGILLLAPPSGKTSDRISMFASEPAVILKISEAKEYLESRRKRVMEAFPVSGRHLHFFSDNAPFPCFRYLEELFTEAENARKSYAKMWQLQEERREAEMKNRKPAPIPDYLYLPNPDDPKLKTLEQYKEEIRQEWSSASEIAKPKKNAVVELGSEDPWFEHFNRQQQEEKHEKKPVEKKVADGKQKRK
jgi:hypothetical protein